MKINLSYIIGVLLIALLANNTGAAEQQDDEAAMLSHVTNAWTGDLDGMFKRRLLRILTVYNPLFFTYDGIEERGIAVEVARAFEKHVNKKYGKKGRPIHVILMPVARDRLLPDLLAGKGDIAVANLTITPARERTVVFSEPTYPDVSELVVTGPSAPEITSFDDLVSTEIHVRPSSSYFEHLTALNKARKQAGAPEIPVRKADERLEDADLLEMLNAGLIPAIVIDSHKAALWVKIYKNITVHADLAVHSGQSIAWAMRPGSPKLMAAVNSFVKTIRKGTLFGNVMIKRYLADTHWVDNVRSEKSRKRYNKTIDIIKTYAEKYDFDWLMITAQGYQESRLDQSKRSRAGAVGIMQILPSTAKDKNVNISGIHKAEQNVHAGVKYLRFIRKRYFSDPGIAPLDQVLFSFAAYNAGPAGITRARKKAAKMGFDPNKWFGHVEIATAKTVSGEPVIYVRNIYKYYIAYVHLEEIRQQRQGLAADGG